MLEIRRKIVHASGVFIIFLILLLGKWNSAIVVFLFALLFFIFGKYRENREKYRIIKSRKLDEFEKFIENSLNGYERPNTSPFKGATEFFVGCFFAIVLFEPRVAMAAISVLSLADATSTLVGIYYGKHRIPLNKKKTFEGSISFFATAFFVLLFFINPFKAFLVSIFSTFAEILPKVDDNLVIPVITGFLMIIIT